MKSVIDLFFILNKKTVLSQGNRAMPQLFFFGLKFADNIRKPGFTAPNIPAQNRI